MHVALVTICYPPEIRSISTMMRELAEELVRRGRRVTVFTSWPEYHLSADAAQRQYTPDTMEGGVRVIRIRTLPTHKVAYVLRGIAQVLLPALFLRAFRQRVRDRVDAVIVYSPHLPLARVGAAIKRAHGARYLLNIQDIFPQNAIDLGILRNPFLIWYFERMERRAYADADALTSHTPGSRQFLIDRKGVPAEKVSLVSNWMDFNAWDHSQPTGTFRARYGLAGKFVFLFAGILGPAQSLEFVLEVASRVRDVPDVRFLFVGDGTEKARLVVRTADLQLPNVQFEPFVDPSEYPMLVKEMDVGLVCLGTAYTTSTIPGKVLGFMAAARPIVAFLNAQNDGHAIIGDAQCGYSCTSDDVTRAAALVRRLYRERGTLDMLGANGAAYARAHYAKQPCIDAIERLLLSR